MATPQTGLELVRLKNLIVGDKSRFGQSEWLELGTLTDCFKLVDGHDRLLRSYRFGDDDYDGCVLSVLRTMIDRNPENLVLIRQFVDGILDEGGENVSSIEAPGRKIVFTPSVFKAPAADVDQNLVSVMMPFEAAFDSVYATIKDAANDAGLECKRADDIWDDSTIIQDVFSLIFQSYIVVCEFTGRNPNVMYEAGIAHTLGKHVVPLTQSTTDIPFDLRHHRILSYLKNKEGLAKMRTELAGRLTTLASKRPSKAPCA